MTLVEVLVVLVIIGVLTGIAVIALGGANQGADVRGEAQRLANRMNLAVDEALVTGTVLVFNWDERNYRFESWNPEDAEWQPHPVDLLGQPHSLSTGLRLKADQGEGYDGQRLLIEPNGAGGPTVISIVGASKDWWIVFDGLSASASPSGG
jgi:general secretion pathway protein H